MLEFIVSQALNAAWLISVLALVALGLGVVYGLMGIINLAHGEFVAIGAYTVVVVSQTGLPFWVALAAAPLFGAAAGLLLERTVIRRLYHRPLDTILVTWGLSLVIQQCLQAVFGGAPRQVDPPVSGLVDVLGVSYPEYRLLVIVAAVVTLSAALVVFQRTDFGLTVRAILQNRAMASAIGINVTRVSALAFATGTALAAIAGGLVAPSVSVTPQMGVYFLAPAFVAVILGGSGRIQGVVAGATFVGGLEIVLNSFAPQTFARAMVLLLAIVVIRLRPQGLLRAARERVA